MGTDGTETLITIKIVPEFSATYNPFEFNQNATILTTMNGDIYMSAKFDDKGYELWKYTAGTTSINTIDKSIIFNVYPNPTSSLLNITCEEEINKD
ncbi:MAG: hypothetical protein R2836_01280 [Chitinophagales bacterium]